MSFAYISAQCEPPVYRFTPAPGASIDFDATYNINTRVTNITGDVAYYDIDGNLQLAPSVNIVSEGAKTYYNPVTNTTQQVTNWTYDYSDRSYKLELNTGDTTTVTYGDEYIRIQEGDTVYNVYYVTNNTTPPLTHTHEWYQTGATQPTCTEYGQKVYTCSTCNEQKTEVLPSLGHAWVQSGTVDAVVDEDGNETEAAYVLYVCSRCGEEYKDYTGVGPPSPPEPPPEENDSSGILAWLKEFKVWLGEKLDALTGGDTVINNDYDITYVDEEGEEQDINVKSIADKFKWWRQVADIGETFIAQVSASEAAAYAYDGTGPSGAPSIPADLSLAQSYYGVNYGGKIEMLDLSWYTPYKKTVDDLISGFMWLFFLWALFRRAPAIISGMGLLESRLSDIRAYNAGSSSTSIAVRGKGK